MRRPRTTLALGLAVLGIGFAGCGGEIEVPEEQAELREGAVLFNERCSGCHTLSAANSFGSKPEGEAESGERTNGPNFDIRAVDKNSALFAIRNGGFSGAIMPANIVVGEKAEKVAEFLAEYSGTEAEEATPGTGAPPQGDDSGAP